MPTFIYSPAVRVHIHSTRLDEIIDVSDDLVGGNIGMAENALGSFSFSLANHRRKYDGVFSPDDRISVQMKRIKWMQTFSGYISQAPYFSVYPRTVVLSGQCTLKRLRYTMWDPGSEAAVQLMHPGVGLPTTDQLKADDDGGLRTRLQSLLINVGNWPQTNIHIGRIPAVWTKQISDLYQSLQTVLAPATPPEATSTGTGASIGGATPTSAGATTVAPDSDPALRTATGALPAYSGTASWFGGPSGGAPFTMGLSKEAGLHPGTPEDPQGLWYCAMRWPYAVMNTAGEITLAVPSNLVDKAKQWWNGRRVLVINTVNQKAVVLRAADWGPATSTGRVIDMSQYALETALAGATDVQVDIRFAPDGAQLGPYTLPPATDSQQAAGQAASTGSKSREDFITIAAAQVGDSYVWGAQPKVSDPNPGAFDCSALVQWAAGRVGVSLPRTSEEQWAAIQAAKTTLTVDQASKTQGALMFPADASHVVISVGDGLHTIEAMGTQYGVVEGSIGNRFANAGTIPGMDYGGATAPVTQGASGTIGIAGSGAMPVVTDTSSWTPQADPESTALVGARMLLNDTPLLSTIQQYANISMRSFMAAPNGDFIAWFPDYFGFYGTAGRMTVETIELLGDGFTVEWSDEYLVTHQFVVGTDIPPTGGGAGIAAGTSLPTDIYSSKGIASVEFPQILAALFNIQSNTDKRADLFLDPQKILKRYGARVDIQQLPFIPAGLTEFWYAIYLLMQSWAQQFSSQVNLTFMPEVYPGMILEIPAYKVQMYVKGVNHSFDFRGSGFTTSVTVTAISATDSSGLYALPLGGSK